MFVKSFHDACVSKLYLISKTSFLRCSKLRSCMRAVFWLRETRMRFAQMFCQKSGQGTEEKEENTFVVICQL